MAGWPVIGRLVRIVVAIIRLPEFRAEYHTLSEINRQLTDAYLDLNHRLHVIDTEELPTLVRSLAEINHRQHILEVERLPALLHDSDNLVKSAPLALRKITRDLIGMKANLESLSIALEEAGLLETKVIGHTSKYDIRRGFEIEEIRPGRLK